ncbi:ECM-binding protein homolog [Anaerococcus prevotii]|uniref:Rib/alpha-like domain-containing protein n=1 Tax=Anaerococcus prevotii TaxID=33034 RepID=UPI000E11B178|nr:Rib/alpha-like domain-containing protein [Anaerococcus prevotii]SUU95106.1 ECM-binding protein homolog [Anaerococcus prevotii]
MDTNDKLVKIIEYKKLKGSIRKPKYATRKLSIGLVSCMLGYALLVSPTSVEATEGNANAKTEVVERGDIEEVETPDEGEAKVEVPVATPEPDEEVITEADNFNAELEKLTAKVGDSSIDYKKAIKNLPEDAKLTVKAPADTKEAGEKTVEATITFADGSEKDLKITVDVKAEEKLEKSNDGADKKEVPTEEQRKQDLANYLTRIEKSTNQEEIDAILEEAADKYKDIDFAPLLNAGIQISEKTEPQALKESNPDEKEFTEAKAKENWDQELKDKGYWKLAEGQRFRRVSASDPVSIYDINYDGTFADAEGNTNLRFIYNELNGVGSGVWHRIVVNFGDLTDKIDFEKSYVVGEDGKTTEKFYDVNGEKRLDITKLYSGPRAGKRVNFPMNIVLKDGKSINEIPKENYIVQLRLVNKARPNVAEGTEIYTYAPKGTSVDYSSYTKVTSVDLSDNISSTVLEGPKQEKGERIAIQRSYMSEFIANPKEYDDSTQIGILRTEYLGKRGGSIGENIKDVDGKPIGFAQVFDAKLVDYLKEDTNGNVAYTNVLTNDRKQGSWVKKIGIKKADITIKDGLAYVVIARNDSVNAFKNNEIKAVGVPTLDQYINQSGIYFSSIDYLIDKTKLNEEFTPGKRKTDFSMAAGWVEPNTKGWTIFEKTFDEDFVVPKGEKYTINTTNVPEGGQVIIQVGDKNQAILRNKQGYYNSTVSFWKQGVDSVDETSPGTYEFTLREGATIKKGEGIRVLLPDTPDHTSPVSFVNQHNADGGTELKVESNSGNIKVKLNNSANGDIKLKYTLKGETEQSEIVYKKKLVGWEKPNDPDNILEGLGKAWITKSKLEPGTKILVEHYDASGKKVDSLESYIIYKELEKSPERYTNIAWVDSTDTLSEVSMRKSLYKPYQVIFTNDYAEGTDDFYKDPKALPSDNTEFMKTTDKIQGYTKYDGGLIRMRTELLDDIALLGKTQALANEYDKDGNVTTDNSSKLTLKGANGEKEYRVYRYDIDLNKLGEISKAGTSARDVDAEGNNKLVLKKDMKLYFNASDGSSLPTELVESRVRTRVLFDTTDGKFADASTRSVRIAPDNVKYLEDAGYTANGFTGANVAEGTGDKFAENPTAEGKTFLGWVTEAGKAELGATTVKSDAFNKLSADKKFTSETPITTHQVVYAIYSDEKLVTFDANGGKFDDNSTTKTDDITDGVQAPTPTQEGKEFVGWASKPDAIEAEAGILDKVTEGQTVYAVWKDAKTQTDAQKNPAVDPTKTEVANKDKLTEDEKAKVVEEVKKANPEAKDVTVDDKGNATLTYEDGTTNEIPGEKTVTEKAKTDAEKNPAVDPTKTEVANKDKLTEDEKAKVVEEVKKANPEAKDVTVDDKGNATLTYEDGTTNEIPGEKTVTEKAKTDAEKNPAVDPTKTEVANKDKLTEDEKAKVVEEVKKANPEAKDVTVDDKGNATLTYEDGTTNEIPGEKTVTEKAKTDAEKNPAVDPTKTEVANKDKLTEDEKAKVVEEVKKANPEAKDVTVDDKGNATLTYEDGTTNEIPGEKTVTEKAKTDAEKNPAVDPTKTEVANKDKLTEDEKAKVVEEVKKANPEAKDVTVDDKGNATLTYEDGTTNEIPGEKTVTEKAKTDAEKNPAVDPTKTEVANKDKLTEDEKAKVVEEVKKANPEAKDVTVDDKGNATLTYEDGTTNEIPGEKTVTEKAKTDAEKNPAVDPTKTEVANKDKLTEDEKAKVVEEVKKANPEAKDVTVDDKGNATLTYEDGTTNEIPGEKTVTEKAKTDAEKNPAVDPTKTEVANKDKLTEDEKAKVVEEVKKANPEAKDVTVDDKGNATLTYEDGTTNEIPGEKTVTEKAKTDAEKNPAVDPTKTEVANKDKLTEDEKAKVVEEVKKANPEAKDVTVDDKGNATLTYEDGTTNEIPGEKTVTEKAKTDAEKNPAVDPTKTEVANKDKLTEDEKAKVVEEVKKANPEAKDVTVDDKGNATLTYEDGTTNEIPGEKTVTEKAKTDAEKNPAVDPTKTEVANKDKLTEDEKAKVVEEVKKANPEAKDVTVDDKGNATLTYEDGTTNEIPGEKTVTEKAKTDAEKNPAVDPTKTEVANKDKLTEDEKAKVVEEVKKANPEAKDVTVDDKGNATLTYEDGTTNEIPGEKTVTEKAKTDAEKNPAVDPTKTEVANKDKLTEDEKAKVVEEVKKANPEAKDVTVDDKGNATLTYEDGTTNEIPGEKTVTEKAKTDAEKNPAVDPTKTEVANKDKLTEDEKAKVVEEVKKANPEAKDVTVDDKGNATLTYEDGTTNEIPGEKTVTEKAKTDAEKNPAVDPTKTEVANKDKLTEDEKAKVVEEVKKANPEAKDVTVDDKGNATLTYEDGTTNEIPGEKTVTEKAKTDAEKNPAVDPTKTEVANKDKLTEDEKAKVVEEVKKANPEAKDVTVDDKGNATLTYEDGTTNEIPADKTVTEKAKTDVDKRPLQNEVDKKDDTKASDKYKNADQDKKDAYDKALEDAKKVLEDPNASQEDVNKAKDALTSAEEALNGKKTPEVDKSALQKEVAKENTTKDTDKYKNADQNKKDAYDKALEDAKKVLENPNASQEDVNKAKDALTAAEEALNGEKTPEVDKSALQKEVDKENTTKDTDKYKNADQDKKDAYNKALADAEKVLKDPNASQDDVNKAKQALEDAEKALNGESTSVDKKALEAEAAKKDTTKASDKYTNADQDKKDAYNKALADAEKVLQDPNASQDDVNKAKKALEDAEKALNGESTSVDKKALEAEAAKKDTTKASDKYTNADQDKKDAYNKALADAEKVLQDPNASQDDVNKAKKALEEAEKALNGKASDVSDNISPNLPGKTEVEDKDNLTEEEKGKVKEEVKKANPKAKDVDVDNKGNATLIYPDGSKNYISSDKTVSEKEKSIKDKTDAEGNLAVAPSKKLGVADKGNLTDAERREIADNVKKANPNAKEVIVDAQGKATLVYPDGSRNFIPASELIYEKAKGLVADKTVQTTNKTGKAANTNVKTGVESLTGVMATLATAVGGLFVSKKRKDDDR